MTEIDDDDDTVDNWQPFAPKLVAKGWPWPLAKASGDPFTYLIGLRDGSIIQFEHLTYHKFSPHWITLSHEGLRFLRGPLWSLLKTDSEDEAFSFERGFCLDIREVIWAVDAPRGS